MPSDSDGWGFATDNGCGSKAGQSVSAFYGLLDGDMTVGEAGCDYAYDLMDAAR